MEQIAESPLSAQSQRVYLAVRNPETTRRGGGWQPPVGKESFEKHS